MCTCRIIFYRAYCLFSWLFSCKYWVFRPWWHHRPVIWKPPFRNKGNRYSGAGNQSYCGLELWHTGAAASAEKKILNDLLLTVWPKWLVRPARWWWQPSCRGDPWSYQAWRSQNQYCSYGVQPTTALWERCMVWIRKWANNFDKLAAAVLEISIFKVAAPPHIYRFPSARTHSFQFSGQVVSFNKNIQI